MTSRLLSSRAAILAALEAGGVRTATTGQYSAPVVVVEPGDPWTSEASLGGVRLGRWALIAIAGRMDSDGAHEELAELVDDVDAALLRLAGVELPTWSKPIDRKLHDTVYASTIATVQLRTAEA